MKIGFGPRPILDPRGIYAGIRDRRFPFARPTFQRTDYGWDIDGPAIMTAWPGAQADAAWFKLFVLSREDGELSLRLLTRF